METLFTYTAEDFDTEIPYQAIFDIKSPFERDVAIEKLTVYAKRLGVNFKKLYKSFLETNKRGEKRIVADGMTEFTGQPMSLNCGQWRCDDFGVSRDGQFGVEEYACPHPVMPVARLVNVDTEEEKIRVAFSKGKRWRTQIVPRVTLSSSSRIVDLASIGISVTSENAKLLVRYFCDMETMNYDELPEERAVGRLGYIEDYGFSPYMDGLSFDGDKEFKNLFNTVKSKGKVSDWKSAAIECRKDSVTARLMLSASFASALVEPCGCLPFFVHLWGVDSGTGKTVGLMLAASVWGEPSLGKYVQTFNGTTVGFEKTAAFLNSLPLCLDELQLTKDGKKRQDFNVYQLAQGVGRTRGNKTGGVQKTPVWHNCILTTGESPLTNTSDGAGAVNRVIEIECTSDSFVVKDGHRIANILSVNYGFAGKAFVKKLMQDGVIDKVKRRYADLFQELSQIDSTEKQAMAAALLLTADELVTKWIFHDGDPLQPSDVIAFMKSKEAVSSGKRGYDYMCDWVTTNANRLRRGADVGDVFGFVEGNVAYIVRSVFINAAEQAGYNTSALLSWLNANGLIITRGKNRSVSRRVAGTPAECIAMKLPTAPTEDDEPESDYI